MGRRAPDRDRELLAEAHRLLPSLTSVVDDYRRDPLDVASRVFAEADLGTRAIVGAHASLAGMDVRELDGALRKHREAVLAAGGAAVAKVAADGTDARLTAEEKAGLEVIFNLTARPAILFQDGTFLSPPPPWETLDDDRDSIDDTAASVGRIQLTGGPTIPYAGTGFLVADDVVMTNAHVAKIFSGMGAGGAWSFRLGMTASIDFVADPDAANTPEFAVTSIIGVHDRFDLALLRVAQTAGSIDAPRPLVIMSSAPDTHLERTVFVVGYPARDPNGAEAMRLVFADIFNVKRLQPGAILAVLDGTGLFTHDCSTLGGNSGSCVVDLETNQVIGLHFQGSYLRYNQAIALWALRGDPLLEGAGVQFS